MAKAQGVFFFFFPQGDSYLSVPLFCLCAIQLALFHRPALKKSQGFLKYERGSAAFLSRRHRMTQQWLSENNNIGV